MPSAGLRVTSEFMMPVLEETTMPKENSVGPGRLAFVVLLILSLQGSLGLAGEDNRISQLLYRYDVLKTQTTDLLDSSRRARREGQVTNDRKSLLYLRKEVIDFCFEVRKYLHIQRTAGTIRPVMDGRGNVLAMAYSCESMEQVLETEFDVHQPGGQNPDLLQIQGKYEEVWKLADTLVMGDAKNLER